MNTPTTPTTPTTPCPAAPAQEQDQYVRIVVDEILERLVRIETRLCKLITVLGHENILQPKE